MEWLFQDSSIVADSRRGTRFTVAPMAVYLILREVPIFPTIAGPELIPMRMRMPMRIRVPRGRRQSWGANLRLMTGEHVRVAGQFVHKTERDAVRDHGENH